MALKEKNNDYIFQPQNDKIGFEKELITIPTDSSYTLTLFKETPDYKFVRASQVGKNHIVFGYEGRADSIDIETDSLIFKVTNKNFIDTSTVRMRELFKDSLTISALKTGTLKLKDTFKLRANTPLITFDAAQFQVMAKDSSFVESTVTLNKKYNWAEVYFPKTEDQTYSINILPGALTDFFEKTNDTIQFNVNTRLESDYGTLNLTLVNVEAFPIIVQILDSKYNIVAEKYLTENKDVFFGALSPDKYFIRIIYDENENRSWDTGSFLNRMQPERIIYYPTQIEVRANWSLNETFILK